MRARESKREPDSAPERAREAGLTSLAFIGIVLLQNSFKYDSVLSRNVKIRYFLSQNVKTRYFLITILTYLIFVSHVSHGVSVKFFK